MKRRPILNRVTVSLTVLAVLITGGFLIAGPLDPPPGPVQPTFKTLAEVEPRVAVNATNTPGDADSLFRITQSGSYYLTGNIEGVARKRGIEIAASGVTLDLMGFTLRGVPQALQGIATSGVQGNLTLRNGTVQDFEGGGINLAFGGVGVGAIVESVRSVRNGIVGIRANAGAIVRSCIVDFNAGGIQVGVASTLEHCVVTNSSTDGIQTDSNCTLTGCTSSYNGASGIRVGTGSTISGCVTSYNTGFGIAASNDTHISGCKAIFNTIGIIAVSSSRIDRCAVYSNSSDGINVSMRCDVMNNTCIGNGSNGIGAGIRLESTDNRVEGNRCTDADFGIRIAGPGNIIIRNTCAGNAVNWDFVPGNAYGTIVATPAGAAVSGDNAGSALGTTDPHANFSY